ncbi:MAG: hypothetical protein FWG30_01765 [Eubacteriaceae bacterium]|nr:hypothetical protein [Eubacteriaceae bacterium]
MCIKFLSKQAIVPSENLGGLLKPTRIARQKRFINATVLTVFVLVGKTKAQCSYL